MRCSYSCGTEEHALSRRSFLRGATGAGLGALAIGGGLGTSGSWLSPAVAAEMSKSHKRILTIFQHGGVSQLETWDPKPNTDPGGPFRPIATSVPGMQICELLPYTAKQMHHLSLVRSINTKNGDHGNGAVQMQTGHNNLGAARPHLGAVVAKSLTPEKFALPGHILIRGAGPSFVTGWKFNSSTHNYERWQDGTPHHTETGNIYADTVVLMQVPVKVLDEVGRLEMKTIGTGPAMVIVNGKKIVGVWQKKSVGERTVFKDERGEEIGLKPGKIWIQVVPRLEAVNFTVL